MERLREAFEAGADPGASVGGLFRVERGAENVLGRDENGENRICRKPVAEVNSSEGQTELERLGSRSGFALNFRSGELELEKKLVPVPARSSRSFRATGIESKRSGLEAEA